jgi:uncharacterized protein with HEPN domain
MSNIPANDAVRLRHMLDAAHKAREFVHGRRRSDLESDEMLALALVRLLEIFGKPPREFRLQYKYNCLLFPGVK